MRAPVIRQESLLEPKVLRHLQPAMNAYFDFKETESCFELYGTISKFISTICGRYDDAIVELVNANTDQKSMEDWISWYVEIFKIIQTSTLAKLADHITLQEGIKITISNRIPCQLGQKYKRSISKCYRDAYEEYIYLISLEPNSRKHQKKKKSRIFSAYNFEFIPCTCGPL